MSMSTLASNATLATTLLILCVAVAIWLAVFFRGN